MSALKSRIPPEVYEGAPSRAGARYLEGLDRRIPARVDLAGGATAADIVTALNTLFADLRTNGMMEN